MYPLPHALRHRRQMTRADEHGRTCVDEQTVTYPEASVTDRIIPARTDLPDYHTVQWKVLPTDEGVKETSKILRSSCPTMSRCLLLRLTRVRIVYRRWGSTVELIIDGPLLSLSAFSLHKYSMYRYQHVNRVYQYGTTPWGFSLVSVAEST